MIAVHVCLACIGLIAGLIVVLSLTAAFRYISKGIGAGLLLASWTFIWSAVLWAILNLVSKKAAYDIEAIVPVLSTAFLIAGVCFERLYTLHAALEKKSSPPRIDRSLLRN